MTSPQSNVNAAVERLMGRWYALAHVLMLFLHLGLFVVSGTMSVALLVGLAGRSLFWSLVWGSVGIFFEGTKIVLWEIGRGGQKLLALLFVGISLTFSAGSALLMVRQAEAVDAAGNVLVDAQSEALRVQDVIIDQQLKVISSYDQSYRDYARVLDQATRTLERAQGEKRRLLDEEKARRELPKKEEDSSSYEATVMFDLMAARLGLARDEFLLLYMALIAGLLEIGALATTYRRDYEAPLAKLKRLLARRRSNASLPALRTCQCGSTSAVMARSSKGLWTCYCPSCKRTSRAYEDPNELINAWNEGAEITRGVSAPRSIS